LMMIMIMMMVVVISMVIWRLLKMIRVIIDDNYERKVFW
jgi:hypothetical protein